MWKAIFDKILESYVYTDPTVSAYYFASKRESEFEAAQEQVWVRPADVRTLRLVEGQLKPREARA